MRVYQHLLTPSKFILLVMIWTRNFTGSNSSLYLLALFETIFVECSTLQDDVTDVTGKWHPVNGSISVDHDLLYENSQTLVQTIATTRSKSLQSFKAMPTILTEVWRHKILTSCRIICDVITSSILMMSSWNLVNLLLFTEYMYW